MVISFFSKNFLADEELTWRKRKGSVRKREGEHSFLAYVQLIVHMPNAFGFIESYTFVTRIHACSAINNDVTVSTLQQVTCLPAAQALTPARDTQKPRNPCFSYDFWVFLWA
jgi:hypothetical protein